MMNFESIKIHIFLNEKADKQVINH